MFDYDQALSDPDSRVFINVSPVEEEEETTDE